MLEFALHEMILQSEHVTYNPDEADYFFVPIYESCFIWPIHGHNPFPYFFKDGVSIGPGMPLLLFLLLLHSGYINVRSVQVVEILL
jgi:hypothetical protein